MKYFWVTRIIVNDSDNAFRDEIKIKTPNELEYEEPEIHRKFIMNSNLTYCEVTEQTGEKVKVHVRVKKEG